MEENSEMDSNLENPEKKSEFQIENESLVKELVKGKEIESYQEFNTANASETNVVYAICDGEDDGSRTEPEEGSVNRGVVLSILRNQNSPRENIIRGSQNREEASEYVTKVTSKHLSLFPNKGRWWHRGQVRYGCQITNMTEEVISKSFIPVYKPEKDKACPICLDDLVSGLVSLNGCLHVYHRSCFLEYALKAKKTNIVCPLCNCISFTGRGPSPPGKMSWNVKRDMTLLSNGTFITTIEIKYKMKSGTQLRWHPRPGKPYKGVSKKAFLPISSEYLFVLKMLILAFLDGQTFRVEDSPEDHMGTTVWNGIEHKTNIDGGVERGGFPDTNYKSRVLDNIISKGVLSFKND